MRHTLRAILVFLAVCPLGPEAAFHYFDPTDSASVPKVLSATGFFTDMATHTATPEAVFFEINAPLWSDGAWKQRWILPPPGKSIPYLDTADFFDYPDSTVFVKDFWLESREGDTTSRVPWETRLLVKQDGSSADNGWRGFSYRWNAARSEAYLVPPNADFDTLFRYTDAGGRRSYKRWRFPSTGCNVCHKTGSAPDASGRRIPGRSVLGFYPAQLKRPAPGKAGINQIADFFSRGLFSGILPDSSALAGRFIGIHEPVPGEASAEERRRILDIKARSYLAANCSGCHGFRGIANRAIGDLKVNFDFYPLSPAIPFAHFPTQTFSLNDTTTFPPTQDPYGRAAFIDAVVLAGLDTGAGKPWNMSLPPHTGDARRSITPALLYPGYPSVSELLYRQARRASALLDSVKLYRYYSIFAANGDSAAIAKLVWLFRKPWGSSAWDDTLAAHGWPLDSVFAVTGQWADGVYRWYRAPEQMPELGTYLPDTSALNVLAEWIRGYSGADGIRARKTKIPGSPRVVGRTLVFPEGGSDPTFMTDLRGRRRALSPLVLGIYRLPGPIRPGIYFIFSGPYSYRIVLHQAAP